MNWLLEKLILVAHAQGGFGGTTGGAGGITIPNPLRLDTIAGVLDSIMTYLIMIGAPIVAIMVIYGGFQILTAGGEPEKFTTGRRTILYAVVGFAIILSAKGVTLILSQLLGGGSGSSGSADQQTLYCNRPENRSDPQCYPP